MQKRLIILGIIIGWFAAASFGISVQSVRCGYSPEEGTTENFNQNLTNRNEALPDVLLIGDSIRGGYQSNVVAKLKGIANVYGAPNNSEGTESALRRLDGWIMRTNNRPWAVIHFNWGLHDIKRMAPNGKGSNSSDDPRQTEVDIYEVNLDILIQRLQKTNAKLIFATTTPCPEGVALRPWRDAEDVFRYNEAALRVMKKYSVQVDDLYSAVKPHLSELQKPANVHFTEEGSAFLADRVVEAIKTALGKQ